MNVKAMLILVLGLTMSFSEGCSISMPGMQGALQPQAPLGPLSTDPNALAGTGLTGSLTGGLPQTPPPFDPALAGLQGQGQTFSPAAPLTTPVNPDPNLNSPAVTAAGSTPSATPLGSGPIDPASLPSLPAADPAGNAALAANPLAGVGTPGLN
jgi:hypothetical protein